MVSKASFYGKYRRLSQDYISEEDEQSIIEMFANYGVSEVQNLLTEGADVDEVDTYGFTPFIYILALNENPEVLSEFIKAGADVNGRFHFSPDRFPSLVQSKVLPLTELGTREIEEIPLTVAAAKNPNPQIVNLLIDQGAIINDANKHIITEYYKLEEYEYERMYNALEVAVEFNNIRVIKALLSHGIKLRTDGDRRITLLEYAINHSYQLVPPSFKDILMLEKNDINKKNIHNAVNSRVWNDPNGTFDEILGMLCSHGFDINWTGGDGTMLTRWAKSMELNKPELCAILNRGADPNIADQDGNTSLHYLCKNSVAKDSELEILLKYGANANAVTNCGDTPLHLLCDHFNQFNNELEFLSSYGANVNAKNRNNETPLSLLLKKLTRWNSGRVPDCDDLVALLKHGAEVQENEASRINELLAKNAEKYNLKLGRNNQLIAQITGGGGKESSADATANKQRVKLYIAIFFILLVFYCIFVYFGGTN